MSLLILDDLTNTTYRVLQSRVSRKAESQIKHLPRTYKNRAMYFFKYTLLILYIRRMMVSSKTVDSTTNIDRYTGLQKCTAAWVITTGYAVFVMYVWFLPLLAEAFDYNDDREFCTANVTCTDGKSGFIGCGCGEGVFGQSSCTVGGYGFTISGFIATAPATGLMAVFSVIPILSMWYYGTGSTSLHPHNNNTSNILKQIAFWSLPPFTLCYALFLGGTYCIFSVLHETVVIMFVIFGIVHFGIIAYLHAFIYNEQTDAFYIATLASVAVIGFLGLAISGFLFMKMDVYSVSYMPWVSECISITAGFAIAPIMIWRGVGSEKQTTIGL